MPLCGWCHGTGIYYGKTCVCSTKRKPYFPKKARKKENDLLPSGHKHDCASVISTSSTYEWWECSCGHTYKVPVS